MVTVSIGGHAMRLSGTDTLLHADKLPLFACDAAPELTFHTRLVSKLTPPAHDPVGRYGNQIVYDEGEYTLCMDTHACYALRHTADLAHIDLALREGYTDVRRLQYQLTLLGAAYRLYATDGLLLHSAGMSIAGDGVVLCGLSGVGKSTLASAITALDDRSQVLSEDAPAVIEQAGGWRLYGTPFCGKDSRCAAADVPLRAIVILRQAMENRIIPLTAGEALYALLTLFPRPAYNASLAQIAVDRAARLATAIPAVRFDNNGDAEAGACLLSALTAIKERRL